MTSRNLPRNPRTGSEPSANRPVSSSLRMIAGFVALALATCGAPGLAVAKSRGPRGAVVTHGPSSKAVAAGPIVMHAYSQFAGGSLYAVRAVTGTDADCANATGRPVALPPDRVASFAVGSGEIACLVTTTKGSFELLWHERPAAPSSPVMIAQTSK
jgi:hypothetical protein